VNTSHLWVFSNSIEWEVKHENSHKVAEMADSGNWHSVVHRDSDAWVERVSNNLGDSSLLGQFNKSLLQLDVSVLDSENDIDSRPVFFLSDLGFVVAIGVIDHIPKHLRFDVGNLVVVL